MKRINYLYNKICDIDVIMKMYDEAIRKNTRNKRKIQRFDNFYSCNIVKIKEILMKKDYKLGKYNIFLIKEPKLRIIMSQDIEDKIINHLVAKYFLIDVFDKTLSDRNCATRKGKGVCIGNMVSQIVATVYLDEIDKFIQEKLRIKAYGRYMDDFYCMHQSKSYLKECLVQIENLLNRYKLKLNNKTKIYSCNENIEFLGFVFSYKNGDIRMKLTNKTKKKFKKKMQMYNKKLSYGNMDFLKYRQVRDSYHGHLSYGNCNHLYSKYVYMRK